MTKWIEKVNIEGINGLARAVDKTKTTPFVTEGEVQTNLDLAWTPQAIKHPTQPVQPDTIGYYI
ncbi:hypothetical protein MAP00_009024 [Monascus purpureus]|nr:hypothetical protein MAP00_009024 [Monascus purpureus]